MILGSERIIRRILCSASLLALAASLTGCPGRTMPSRPLPPLDERSSTASPTPTVEAARPSLTPPAAADSLPPNPPAQLAAAARISDRARRELDAGRGERAIELLEQGVQVDPTAPFPYYYLAAAYLGRGRSEEALVFSERAANLAAGYPAEWQGHTQAMRGRVLEALGRDEDAESAYDRALELDPRNAPAERGLQRLR